MSIEVKDIVIGEFEVAFSFLISTTLGLGLSTMEISIGLELDSGLRTMRISVGLALGLRLSMATGFTGSTGIYEALVSTAR
jgi:hypothetical protein